MSPRSQEHSTATCFLFFCFFRFAVRSYCQADVFHGQLSVPVAVVVAMVVVVVGVGVIVSVEIRLMIEDAKVVA